MEYIKLDLQLMQPTFCYRYAVLQKDGIVIKEKLLDFKATVGAQVASTVL